MSEEQKYIFVALTEEQIEYLTTFLDEASGPPGILTVTEDQIVVAIRKALTDDAITTDEWAQQTAEAIAQHIADRDLELGERIRILKPPRKRH